MPSMLLPTNVSSITVNGDAKVPSGGRIDLTAAEFATLTGAGGIATKPFLVKAALVGGDTTIRFPSIVTSVTINAVAYVPDGSGDIVVPAAAASNFLEQNKYAL